MKRLFFFLALLCSLQAFAAPGPILKITNNTLCTLYVRADAADITSCTSAYTTNVTQILPLGGTLTWYGGQGMPVPWSGTVPTGVVRFMRVYVGNDPTCGLSTGTGCTGDVVVMNVPCVPPATLGACFRINNPCAGCALGTVVNAVLTLASMGSTIYDVNVNLT